MKLRTIIIAEAGVNHNGDLGLAKRLVDAAATAGADYVKFQTFSADRLVTGEANKAKYQVDEISNLNETQFQMLKKLEMSQEMHHELISYCNDKCIGFLSSGFDVESINFLFSIGLRIFKIPSGEITNLPYLRHIGSLGAQVILSTGMSSMYEVGAALKILESAGLGREKISLLHCTTEYPTPMHDVNLSAIKSMKDYFGLSVGYSDHTNGIEVAIAAVALGATIVEKHFTLNRNMTGPDHKASLEPKELTKMIESIRNIEVAMGDGVKQITTSEIKNLAVIRKSIVAACKILVGEEFTPENITVKRPGDGISPMYWDDILGRKSTREYQKDELIRL